MMVISKSAGKYSNWIIKNFVQKFKNTEDKTEEELKADRELFFEDLYKTNEDLQKFDRFKSRLDNKDINSYNFEKLYDAVKDFDLTMAQTTKAERKIVTIQVVKLSMMVQSGRLLKFLMKVN